MTKNRGVFFPLKREKQQFGYKYVDAVSIEGDIPVAKTEPHGWRQHAFMRWQG